MSNRLLEGGREEEEAKRRINREENIAAYIEAKRQVKRILKHEKRNKELSIA